MGVAAMFPLSPISPLSRRLNGSANEAADSSPDLLRVLSPACAHAPKLLKSATRQRSKSLLVESQGTQFSPQPAEPPARPAGAIWQRVRRAQALPSPQLKQVDKRPPVTPRLRARSTDHIEVETQQEVGLLIKKLDEVIQEAEEDESEALYHGEVTVSHEPEDGSKASKGREDRASGGDKDVNVPETPAMERRLRSLSPRSFPVDFLAKCCGLRISC